jgi:3-hydroxypropanoate dehydrogenase
LEHSQHIKQIFTEARTHRFFTDQLVEDNILKQLYEVVKNAPTASNTCPMRVTFVKSAVEKTKLLEVIAEGNKPKAATAPVIAIVSYDMKFFDHLDNLAPHLDKSNFAQMSEDAIRTQASNNTWLQGGYLILAARALGLDCGAMAGFDRERTNKLFFNNSSWRAAFLLSLGYGSGKNIRDRAPRLLFEDACKIV